jgi:NADPH-dependent 7-cyano-7-deazaguanine reductase QueF-like protein
MQPQPAYFYGLLYDMTWLSKRGMPTVAQTLRELPTLANGLEAES